MDIMSKAFIALLERAEASLSCHLTESPDSQYIKLRPFYEEFRAGVLCREAYPDARHLFWDSPVTEKEEQCLMDALRVFNAVREG